MRITHAVIAFVIGAIMMFLLLGIFMALQFYQDWEALHAITQVGAKGSTLFSV